MNFVHDLLGSQYHSPRAHMIYVQRNVSAHVALDDLYDQTPFRMFGICE